jgi:hypothetical protein
MEPLAAVALALIASVIAPAVLLVLTGRQEAAKEERQARIRAAERQADEDRQDEVALRVEKVAQDAAAAQEANAGTLHDIHTLVNSDMTAARTAELTATRLLVASLRRNPDDAETSKAIEDGVARITELEQILADRLVAQRKVEADTAAAQAAKS